MCQSSCYGWADGNFLAEFLLTNFMSSSVPICTSKAKKYIVFSPLSPLLCFTKKKCSFENTRWWNIPITDQKSMGLDSVKERHKESKADKNQTKDCRLKREERQNPHILLWWFIALFSFSQPILCLIYVWCE